MTSTPNAEQPQGLTTAEAQQRLGDEDPFMGYPFASFICRTSFYNLSNKRRRRSTFVVRQRLFQ